LLKASREGLAICGEGDLKTSFFDYVKHSVRTKIITRSSKLLQWVPLQNRGGNKSTKYTASKN
jgi:hypothetical protein